MGFLGIKEPSFYTPKQLVLDYSIFQGLESFDYGLYDNFLLFNDIKR